MAHATTPSLTMQDYFTTTLTGNVAVGDTVFSLANVPTGTEGFLVIDPNNPTTREIIYYTAKGTSTVTTPDATANSGRGVGGTSVQTHTSGTLVEMREVAEYWKALQNGQSLNYVPSTAALFNPYKFSVYRAAGWSAPATSSSVVQMDTKDYDTGTNVDIVTHPGRFTAPVSGFYHFSCSVSYAITAVGNGFVVSLYKNASEVRRGVQIYQTVNGAVLGAVVSADLQLTAGDFVEIYMFNGGTQVGATGGVGSALTYFQGHLTSTT